MFVIIVLIVVSGLVASGDAACRCVNTCAGKHCGRSPLMSGCAANNIYQCNGVYNSLAHNYGGCSRGCVYKGCSRDYCK